MKLFDRSSDSEFLWGRYRSGSDTDLARRNGRKDKERRFVRPSNPRAHVELEEFHPHTWWRKGKGEGVPKCVGRSHTCKERASENFYDTLAAFMSRVNLANSASFAPRHLAPRGLSSFSRLTCRSECTAGDAIKPARNDAVPQSLLPSRARWCEKANAT